MSEKNDRKYPRVLVISYNCFSLGGSNGRTLANLFFDWSKNCIAQLYMCMEIPDHDVCNNYFRVTDIDMINSFRYKNTSGIITLKDKDSRKITLKENNLFEKLKTKKSQNKVKMKLLRAYMWNMGFWKTKTFYKWLKEFKPEIIFVMSGSTFFIDKIALDLSKRLNIPIVVYNCENYQFKDYRCHGIWGKLFKASLVKSYDKLMKRTSYVIYLNEPLQELFKTKYPIESTVIYNSSFVEINLQSTEKEHLIISYLGSIVGRYQSLINIAEAINQIDNSLFLDLYGRIDNENIKEEIENCNTIKYHGLISYSNVLEVIAQSDIIVHCESFDESEIVDKEFAFSTKISDSLSSGKCFFVFAPKSNAAVKYLIKNNAACVATNSFDLKEKLRVLIENKEMRDFYSKKAYELAKINHNIKINSKKVFQIIEKSLNEWEKIND
jgi:hypothetical protein